MQVQSASSTASLNAANATPTSPTRPSRLRGLSYLRSYTRDHLHSYSANNTPRAEAPPLVRSTSSPGATTPNSSPPPQLTTFERGSGSAIQSGENGWIPAIQGRREAAPTTSTSTDTAAPEPSSSMAMTRNRVIPAPTPTTNRHASDASHPTLRRPSAFEIASSTADASASATASRDQHPVIRFIPHIETRSSSRPSLRFDALSRTLKTPGSVVRVGRYSERDNNPTNADNGLPVGFKSKVVSRRHCEFWCTDGQWYIKDVKSSSGTFLNHVRLSSPGLESRPYPVNDGDIVQLGIDFKGGEEVIFRCVKIRIECNRGWQKSLNAFNTTAHKRLFKSAFKAKSRDSDAASVNSSECSICLNPVAPCQALFVAPCSHVWHFKCVRGLINSQHYPNFSCPNCRFVADLEADVEQPDEGDYETDEAEDQPDVLPAEDDMSRHSPEAESGPTQSDASYEHVQRTSSATRLGSISRQQEVDNDLARLVDEASLRTPSPQQEHSSDSTDPVPTSTSRPIRIGQPMSSTRYASGPSGARSVTPTSHASFALSAGPLVDGPMTPRNDAGPFLLESQATDAGGLHVL